MEDREALDIGVHQLDCGATVLDFGIQVKGSWESAELFTRISLGDMGRMSYGTWPLDSQTSLASVELLVSQPLIACLGSQIAGWQLGTGEFATIGSGPARAVAAVSTDPYLAMTPYRDSAAEVVLCIQDTRLPGDAIALEVAAKCKLAPDKVFLVVAPSACLVGSVQVAARMIEQCCHKMFAHGFEVTQVTNSRGRAPVAPVCTDEVKAIGRINDAILYAGEAEFWVDAPDADIEKVVPQLVSVSSSPEYGVPFADIFERAGRNFYNIDHEIHSIARIHLHSIRSGRCYSAGELNMDLIRTSFLS
jgi:methenyltetrahydromethanopterin cyclohydrolase